MAVKVLTFSYCFPRKDNPNWCIQALRRRVALARVVDLEVVSPVPTFPVYTGLKSGPIAKREEIAGLKVHRPRYFYFPGILKDLDGLFYGTGLAGWARDYCKRKRPDLFEAHFIWPDGVGVSHLSRKTGVPYAILLGGMIFPCLERTWQRRQCARALRGAAAIVSLSRQMTDVAVELGADPGRIFSSPNGVDKDLFKFRDKPWARQQVGMPPGGKVVAAIAHLKQTKGHDDLLKALVKLPKDTKLVIVGGSPDGGGYRRRLQETIERSGLADRVVLAGRQHHDRVPLYLNAADVSVLASHREGCPNVVLESLACGTPVVASDVGSVREMFSSRADVRIFPPGDIDALSDGIAAFLADAQAGALATDDGVKSWDDVARDMFAIFTAALSGRKVSVSH